MVAFILFIVSIPIINNIIADTVESTLKDTPLPANTKLIDSVSKAGKLVGNGNGMQHFGAILIKSSLSQKELDDFYSNYRNNSWDYIVEKQTTNEITMIHGNISFKKVDNINTSSDYFIVYSWGGKHNGILDMDLRGH